MITYNEQISFPKVGPAGFSIEEYTFWMLLLIYYSQAVKRNITQHRRS